MGMKSTRKSLEQLDVRCQTLSDRAVGLEKDGQVLETIQMRLNALDGGVVAKHARTIVEPQLQGVEQKVVAVASKLHGIHEELACGDVGRSRNSEFEADLGDIAERLMFLLNDLTACMAHSDNGRVA